MYYFKNLIFFLPMLSIGSVDLEGVVSFDRKFVAVAEKLEAVPAVVLVR